MSVFSTGVILQQMLDKAAIIYENPINQIQIILELS